MPILNDKEREELIHWRRDFHAHPELAFQETRTAAIVAQHLKDCGYEVKTGVAKTGVVGVLRGQHEGKTILLRADMDGLPIQEENEVPYRSQHPGRMHACGHDGHTAILMAVAQKLKEKQSELKGTVKLVFQPAEEGGNGAEHMIRENVLENPRVDAAFGLHLWNNLPAGTLGLNPGPLMAGIDMFTIRVTGKGGHGAAPHQTVDALMVAARIATGLQTIVSRNVDPLQSAVITIGSFHSGTAFNIIPETAELTGTVRYFDSELGTQLPKWIERMVRGVTESHGAGYELKYEVSAPPTINNAAMAALVREVGCTIAGEPNVRMDARTMGSEDMSFFLQAVPGCFFFVGSANPERKLDFPHHAPRFDIDESSLETGVEMLCGIVESYL